MQSDSAYLQELGFGIYVSLVQPGDHNLACVACTPKKTSAEKLQCSNGVGSDVFGRIIRDAGQHMFHRTTQGPAYVCVPLKHNGRALGTLAAHAFEFDSQPTNTFKLLTAIAAWTGRALDMRRKCDSLAALHIQMQDYGTIADTALVHAVTWSIIFIITCEIWELNDERQLTVVSATAPLSSAMAAGRWDMSDLSSDTFLPWKSRLSLPMQTAVGGLIHASICAKSLDIKFTGLNSQVAIVPFVNFTRPRLLALILPRNVQLRDADLSFVLALAACMQVSP